MFGKELEIIEFIPHVETNERLNRYIDFQERIMKAYFPMDIIEPRTIMIQELQRAPSRTWKNIRYIVEDKQKIIAEGQLGFLMLSHDANPERCHLWVVVDPQYARKGIGKALLSILSEKAKIYGRTIFTTNISTATPEKAGIKLLEKVGAKKVLEEKENRLYRNNVNWEFINETKPRLLEKLNKYRFEFMTSKEHLHRIETDDAYAEERADFLTEVGNLVPRGDADEEDEVVTKEDLRKDLERSKNSPWETQFIFAFEGDKMIGQTGVFHWKEIDFPYVETGLTGVRKAYQGQGLAKLLKCMITEYIFEKYPTVQFIGTENADTNAPMLSINQRLGFEEAYRWIKYEGKIKEIDLFLNDQKST
ncbi:MAG: GNAT family N-acetyltransferase [Methanobacteriota archaeon]|nr:MAG: GNAT family N-acetyltransferase [Euryarchaeota archaeon]